MIFRIVTQDCNTIMLQRPHAHKKKTESSDERPALFMFLQKVMLPSDLWNLIRHFKDANQIVAELSRKYGWPGSCVHAYTVSALGVNVNSLED